MTFGYGLKVWHKPGAFKFNAKYPELFDALIAFGNTVVPKGWTYDAITLNKDMVAKKHTDSKNAGHSVIVGFGDYDGGELSVWGIEGTPTENKFKNYDIRDRPLLFNGSLMPHSGRPFRGSRYTIVFHKQNVDLPDKNRVLRGK